MRLALGFAVLASIFVPAVAGAQVAPPQVDPVPAPSAPPPASTWYGDKLAMTDVPSFALLLAGTGLAFSPAKTSLGMGVLAVGLGGYAVLPPILHALNGESGHAGPSLALRLLLPAATGAISGLVAEHSGDPNADHGGAEVARFAVAGTAGALVGAVVGAVIDDAFVARHHPSDKRDDEDARGFVPMLTPVAGGATAGVGGAF